MSSASSNEARMSDHAVTEPDREPGTKSRRWVAVLAAAALGSGLALAARAIFTDTWNLAERVLAEAFVDPGEGPPLVYQSGEGGAALRFGAAPPAGLAPVRVLDFRREDSRTFSVWPPGPLDVAVVWQVLEEAGLAEVVAAAMPWPSGAAEDGSGQMDLDGQALLGVVTRSSLRGCFGVEVLMAAEAGDEELARLAWGVDLPEGAGPGEALPQVNAVRGAMPPEEAAVAGFLRVIGEEATEAAEGDWALRVPVAVRAGEKVLAHQAVVAWAMAAGDGADLRWTGDGFEAGAGGRVLPVAADGTILLPKDRLRRIVRGSVLDPLDAAMQGDGSEAQDKGGGDSNLVFLSVEAAEGSGGAWAEPALIGAAIASVLVEEDPVGHAHFLHRLPVVTLVLVVVLGVAVAFFVSLLPRYVAVGCFLLFLGGYGLAFALSVRAGYFHDPGPVIAGWLFAFQRAVFR